MSIPTFREVQDDITAQLRDQGFLAAILVDLGPLAHIERAFGGAAFRALRAQVDPLLEDMRERFRQDDFITRDEREGDRFLLFLSGPRRGDSPFRSENLRKLVERVEDFLNPRVGRLTLPYLRERPTLVAGYGLVLWSPLESPERQVLRLVDDAVACAEMRARVREREQRERLLEIIQNREIWTAFQPIVELGSGQPMGWEGLSRGPRGSDLELPIVLFGRAARYGIVEELERACRRQAFVDWQRLRPDRPPLRQHRARHRPRHELPRPRRPRLPRPRARPERRHPGDHRAAGHREPQPLPRGDARLHRPRLLLRHRRRGRGLLGARDGGRPQAGLPEDRHRPRARRAPEEGEPAGGEGHPGHGRGPRGHGDRRGHPDEGRGRGAAATSASPGARATSSPGRSTPTPRSRAPPAEG